MPLTQEWPRPGVVGAQSPLFSSARKQRYATHGASLPSEEFARRLYPRCYPMQVSAAVTGRKLRQGVPACRSVSPRKWIAAAVLLAQFQLLCLTAFHHHALASLAHPASSTSIGTPDRQGAPVDESRSCPICQFVRHNPTAPPRSVALSAASLASRRITPSIAAKPLVASRVRLAGRDPPSSFQAS
jgi:hypothetical protein